MFVQLKNSQFIVGEFGKVVNFLAKKIKKTKKTQIILPCSLHDLALKNEKNYFEFYKNIDYCTSDSMLITNYFRYKYKKKINRVYGPDLMVAVFDQNINNKIKTKHYLLSPNQKTMKHLSAHFKKNYPKINMIFDYLPRNTSKKQELLHYQKIIETKPEFIWIGIGSPKQLEIASWLKNHSKGIKIFCVGAAFEFISGQKKQAPVWMQKNNLEWMFRLFNEPKRLWKRYLITIPRYLLLNRFKSKY